jgi:ephrin-B
MPKAPCVPEPDLIECIVAATPRTTSLTTSKAAATTTTTPTIAVANITNSTNNGAPSQSKGSGTGAKVFAILLVIVLIVAVAWRVAWYRGAQNRDAFAIEGMELQGINMIGMEENPIATLNRMKKQKHNFENTLDKMLANGRLNSLSAIDRKVPREISRNSVDLVTQIGSGQFGAVWKGLLDESSWTGTPAYSVAVKTVKEVKGSAGAASALDELVQEATVMAQCGQHDNLISLIGVHTTTAEKMIVLSICEHGDLKSLLETKSEAGEPIDTISKLMMMVEVARGMSHLSAKGFVHRDLAARNVLLSENSSGMVCKIADFGLARATQTSGADGGEDEDDEDATYYRSHGSAFAVRWTAPESMTSFKFDQKSDVWSYGVTM